MKPVPTKTATGSAASNQIRSTSLRNVLQSSIPIQAQADFRLGAHQADRAIIPALADDIASTAASPPTFHRDAEDLQMGNYVYWPGQGSPNFLTGSGRRNRKHRRPQNPAAPHGFSRRKPCRFHFQHRDFPDATVFEAALERRGISQ